MESTAPVLSLNVLIIGGGGREGMRRKVGVEGKEEMELLLWMNKEQL